LSGRLVLDGTVLTETVIEADLSQLTTNDSRRDTRARGALATSQFPIATFVLGEPVDLGEAADNGGPVSVVAIGELTVKGVTRSVQFEIDAQLVGDVIAVVGTTNVVFSDFGVTAPSSAIVLSVADNGVIEFQLLFVRS
jgi:polyisoprenoid-binding protein YceI